MSIDLFMIWAYLFLFMKISTVLSTDYIPTTVTQIHLV